MSSPDLEHWLERATRGLVPESVSQVRDEIRQHYELAREGEISIGLSPEEADRSALSALGDAKAANTRIAAC